MDLERTQAVREADDMQAEVDAKTERLQEKLEQALMQGDMRATLKYQEGMMRVAYAPTIHMYRSYDANDRQVVATIKQIDDAIDSSLRQTAASWGVEYVPAARAQLARVRRGGGRTRTEGRKTR